ncbi:MAG: hypothetical protein J5I65_13225 [Aridibacter famidurans]|nr:hypothetical protein [Aridibacter famidurans]
MIEGTPFILPLLITLSAGFCAAMLIAAARRAGASVIAIGALAGVSALILIVQACLGYSGFYLEMNSPAPRFITAAPPAVLILLLFVLLGMPRGDAPLRTLTLLHTVRVPVELVLWGLFVYGKVPQLMTFEGINPDIISGLTAPFAAWIGFRDGKPRRAILIVWNLAALALLLNIVWHAVLSVPTPFQRYGFEQPNVGVLYFPFIWLPAFIVPAVFAAHVWSLRELIFPQRSSKPI